MGLAFIVSNPHFRPHLEFGSLFCTPRCVRHLEGAGIAEIPYKKRGLEKGSARPGPRQGAPQSRRRSRGRVTRQSDNPSPGLGPAAPGSLSGSAARGAALGPRSPAGRSCRDRVGLSLGLPRRPCGGNGEVRAAARQRSEQIPKLLPSPCRRQ